jgi:hypothetical protein
MWEERKRFQLQRDLLARPQLTADLATRLWPNLIARSKVTVDKRASPPWVQSSQAGAQQKAEAAVKQGVLLVGTQLDFLERGTLEAQSEQKNEQDIQEKELLNEKERMREAELEAQRLTWTRYQRTSEDQGKNM